MYKSYIVGKQYHIGKKAFYVTSGKLNLPADRVVTCHKIDSEGECLSSDPTYMDDLDPKEQWWVGTLDDLADGYVTLIDD